MRPVGSASFLEERRKDAVRRMRAGRENALSTSPVSLVSAHKRCITGSGLLPTVAFENSTLSLSTFPLAECPTARNENCEQFFAAVRWHRASRPTCGRATELPRRSARNSESATTQQSVLRGHFDAAGLSLKKPKLLAQLSIRISRSRGDTEMFLRALASP